jgi:ketosteroid isomerase-like protein
LTRHDTLWHLFSKAIVARRHPTSWASSVGKTGLLGPTASRGTAALKSISAADNTDDPKGGDTTVSDDAIAILNLLYSYAEGIDAGDFAGVSAMFAHADVKIGEGNIMHGSAPMQKMWEENTKRHADGTLLTKHVITNPILEIAEDHKTATVRSYYTVIQATATVPLQVIAAGRYHDAFEKIDGKWRFCKRDYSFLDLKGELSDHLFTYR